MLLKRIISPLVILLYLVASIGFSFSNCQCQQPKSMVVVAGNHCSCSHTTEHNADPCGSKCNHDTDDSSCSNNCNCCQVVYKAIDVDQNQPNVLVNNFSFEYSLLAVLTPIYSLFDNNINVDNNWTAFIKSPPNYSKTALIYLHKQLRL